MQILIFTKSAGVGPFDLVIDGSTYNGISSGDIVTSVSPASTTTYTLTSITDKGVDPNFTNTTVSVPTTVTVVAMPTVTISLPGISFLLYVNNTGESGYNGNPGRLFHLYLHTHGSYTQYSC